mgnify:CR=1 FL=1
MDELGDGRIDDGYGSWLTFFGGRDNVLGATLLARCIVFSDDCVLVDEIG